MPIEVHVVSAEKFKEWVAAAANDIDAAHKLLTSDGPDEHGERQGRRQIGAVLTEVNIGPGRPAPAAPA